LNFTAIAAGADHSCALDPAGNAWCWGSNQYQQLGSAVPAGLCGNGLACSASPLRVEGAPAFTALAASLWGTCGLDENGAAHCWGFGLGGRQGNGLPASSGVPMQVPGDHRFVTLAASAAGNQTCGLTATGQAWCWSADGSAGSAGAFTGPDRIDTSQRLVAIGIGTQHGCGLTDARHAVCWGSNQFGQLGTGSSALGGGIRESSAPLAVRGGHSFNSIVAGPGHSCGIGTDELVYCWGLSFTGNAENLPFSRPGGSGSIPHGALPIVVKTGGAEWLTLSAGTTQTCALGSDASVYCFTTTPVSNGASRSPVRIDSDEHYGSLASGGSHACAISTAGFAYCWGLSHLGQGGRVPGGN
jgi:alpha-tubulin suppressor-like RCC1 family protein